MGLQITKFYKEMVRQSYAVNTASTWTIPIRSFLSQHATQVKIRRGTIARRMIASNETALLLFKINTYWRFTKAPTDREEEQTPCQQISGDEEEDISYGEKTRKRTNKP